MTQWRITFRLPDVEPQARCVAAPSSARQLYILPQSWRVRTDRRERGKTEDLAQARPERVSLLLSAVVSLTQLVPIMEVNSLFLCQFHKIHVILE